MVAALLQQVASTVVIARELAASGRKVDLEGLDLLTGRLCAHALDLPVEAGASLRPALIELAEKLGSLSEAIEGCAR